VRRRGLGWNQDWSVLREIIAHWKQAARVLDVLISDDDMDGFLAHLKELVEHPAEILANIENLAEQQALYSLVFERRPTYPEIVSGTAKLTAVFSAFQRTPYAESFSVHPVGIEPTTLSLRGTCSTS
jgi:hypothetical protein